MKYVLDSTAALPWVLPEKDSAKAIQRREDARNAVHELLAPHIFPAEVFNALLKAERTKRISFGQAKTLYASIGADIPALHPYLPLMPRAGDIASRYRVALYDSLYIALAERESCEVITADRGITSLQAQFSFIVPLASL
jgi:predicted nucleic acid-binding protein